MANHNNIGIVGEKIALTFLTEKGYQILAKNWRFKRKELDIIATINDCIIFVEVKTRKRYSHGYPEAAITKKKIDNIYICASQFVYQRGHTKEIRFDVISITLHPFLELIHFEDAFFPSW